VIKDGTGTLTLPAANAYSGATTVAQGIIHLTGSVTSHVTLNPPGTLNCDDGTLSGGLTNNGGTASSVPGAPSGVTPGPANGHANVAFTPGAAHCFPISYAATSSPGAVHGSGIGSPINVSPLIDGTAYTFTVTATNPIGSAASAPSAAIVPKGPLPIARIISPARRHFKLGQFVATSFSCADAGDGPGIAACTDSGNGVLNTSHAGAFTYSVVAVSKDGQATVTQIRYVVLFPGNQLGRPQVRSNRDGSVSFALKLPGAGNGRGARERVAEQPRGRGRAQAGQRTVRVRPRIRASEAGRDDQAARETELCGSQTSAPAPPPGSRPPLDQLHPDAR
jgi:autotransporter-associated beta strand protein